MLTFELTCHIAWPTNFLLSAPIWCHVANSKSHGLCGSASLNGGTEYSFYASFSNPSHAAPLRSPISPLRNSYLVIFMDTSSLDQTLLPRSLYSVDLFLFAKHSQLSGQPCVPLWQPPNPIAVFKKKQWGNVSLSLSWLVEIVQDLILRPLIASWGLLFGDSCTLSPFTWLKFLCGFWLLESVGFWMENDYKSILNRDIWVRAFASY